MNIKIPFPWTLAGFQKAASELEQAVRDERGRNIVITQQSDASGNPSGLLSLDVSNLKPRDITFALGDVPSFQRALAEVKRYEAQKAARVVGVGTQTNPDTGNLVGVIKLIHEL